MSGMPTIAPAIVATRTIPTTIETSPNIIAINLPVKDNIKEKILHINLKIKPIGENI